MKYYVNTNAQDTGEHEVHTSGCPHPPAPANRKQLGDFSSCKPAVAAAKKIYSKVDGCAYCCPACHKK